MKENAIYITTATIRFYDKLYLFPTSENYNFIIKFDDSSLCSPNNRIYVELNSSYERSTKMFDAVRRHLALNGVFDGIKVSVIYNSDGFIAIGANDEDKYFDIQNNFTKKTFSQLSLNIISLIIVA